MARVTHVIFDLGRVLIDFDHRIAADKVAALSRKTPEEIYALFFDSKLTRWFEEGKVEPEQFYGKVKRILRIKLDYEKFVPIWDDIFFLTESNRQVHSLAMRLKKQCTVSVLSNINILHLEFIRSKFRVFEGFDNVFASCDLGCVKPSACIYSRTLKALGAAPGEVFYTDDRPELIKKARSMGMRAFVFSGVEQLKQDLARCGLSTE